VPDGWMTPLFIGETKNASIGLVIRGDLRREGCFKVVPLLVPYAVQEL